MRALLTLLFACLAAPAAAQTLSHQPEWAMPILSADPDAIAVGSDLKTPSAGVRARVVVAPAAGGVARLINYVSDGAGARLEVFRFTGHLRNGWSLWGGEAPAQIPLPAATKTQFDALAKRAIAAVGLSGESSDASRACADGDYLLIEAADASRKASVERRCTWDGATGALAKALSERAGSRDEEELFQSGVEEILAADRAFSKAAREKGVPAAMAAFAGDDAKLFLSGSPTADGRDAIETRYADWDPSKLLQWAPAGAEVAARGDMGYSWGDWTLTQPGKEPEKGHYVSVWKRDPDGQWRFAANIGN